MSTKHERTDGLRDEALGRIAPLGRSPGTAACASGAARKAERPGPKSSITWSQSATAALRGS